MRQQDPIEKPTSHERTQSPETSSRERLAGSYWCTEIIKVRGHFFQFVAFSHLWNSVRQHQKIMKMTTPCTNSSPPIRNEKKWDRCNWYFYLFFENWLSINISGPLVSKMRLSIRKKPLILHYTPVSMCLLSSKAYPKQLFVNGQGKPYQIWSTHFWIQQPYTKVLKKQMTLHYIPVSLCLLLSKTCLNRFLCGRSSYPIQKIWLVSVKLLNSATFGREILILSQFLDKDIQKYQLK